jgi:5-methylcytosine-specific restriction endonuclease McrA
MRGGHAHVKRIEATGTNGRPACCQCGGDIEKGSGRRKFCSEKCARDFSAQFFWGMMRHRVFERDKGACQICGTETQMIGFDVDHIVPLVEGGTNAMENLRILCRPCHLNETKKLRARLSAKRKGESL